MVAKLDYKEGLFLSISLPFSFPHFLSFSVFLVQMWAAGLWIHCQVCLHALSVGVGPMSEYVCRGQCVDSVCWAVFRAELLGVTKCCIHFYIVHLL